MARGTQLLRLTAMLREELGRSSSVAVGIEDVRGLKRKLSRNQELLYDQYDWPHLVQWHARKQMQAGERYYDLPLTLNFERIMDGAEQEPGVVVWWNNIPTPIARGISWRQYATYNSDDDIRADPVMRWDIRDTTGTAEPQFEVWPVPASDTSYVQMRGVRKLNPLVNDSDCADLDDQLIVLYTAAEILAQEQAASAEFIANMAKARFDRLKGRSANNRRAYRMGMGSGLPAKPVIVVRAN